MVYLCGCMCWIITIIKCNSTMVKRWSKNYIKLCIVALFSSILCRNYLIKLFFLTSFCSAHILIDNPLFSAAFSLNSLHEVIFIILGIPFFNNLFSTDHLVNNIISYKVAAGLICSNFVSALLFNIQIYNTLLINSGI